MFHVEALSLADSVGWMATAVFVASYFFSKPAMLRGLQMLGAALWMTFGVLIASKPVIVANVLVFAAAGWTLLRQRGATRSAPAAS
jgi:hypothetical protein